LKIPFTPYLFNGRFRPVKYVRLTAFLYAIRLYQQVFAPKVTSLSVHSVDLLLTASEFASIIAHKTIVQDQDQDQRRTSMLRLDEPK